MKTCIRLVLFCIFGLLGALPSFGRGDRGTGGHLIRNYDYCGGYYADCGNQGQPSTWTPAETEYATYGRRDDLRYRRSGYSSAPRSISTTSSILIGGVIGAVADRRQPVRGALIGAASAGLISTICNRIERPTRTASVVTVTPDLRDARSDEDLRRIYGGHAEQLINQRSWGR